MKWREQTNPFKSSATATGTFRSGSRLGFRIAEIPIHGLSPAPSPSHPLCEHGLVELGAFRINNLRRSPKVEFYPWNPISAIPKSKRKQKKSRPNGLETARYYQSLLDSGVVQTRAELARHLGFSRARVTQVLRRLERPKDDVA